MKITYTTNGSATTKSLTEWFFGAKTVSSLTAAVKRMYKASGKREFRFWQDGTGYLGIRVEG